MKPGFKNYKNAKIETLKSKNVEVKTLKSKKSVNLHEGKPLVKKLEHPFEKKTL